MSITNIVYKTNNEFKEFIFFNNIGFNIQSR